MRCISINLLPRNEFRMTSASKLVDNIICAIVALSPILGRNQVPKHAISQAQWNGSAGVLILIYEEKSPNDFRRLRRSNQ